VHGVALEYAILVSLAEKASSGYELARRFDKSIGQFAHPAGFVVLTPDGRISRYLLGFEHGPAALKTAVAEAARDQVEPPAHPLLLLCFGYDPQGGTIAYTAMQALRIAALGAVAALALYVLAALRRERTR
jgi:protein SCO1/2